MRLQVRRALARLLDRAQVPAGVFRLRRRGRPRWLTMINYHRIQARGAAVPGDAGVIDTTPDAFDNQLAVLAEHFTPVGLRDVLAFLEGAELPPNPALVTFDDGYRDNYEQALPILLRRRVPAAFFVATGFVGGRRVFWWDRLSWLVKQAQRRRFSLEYPCPMQFDLEREGVERTSRRLHVVVKDTYDLDLERFLTEVEQACEAQWNAGVEERLAEELVMTWQHVRTLRAAGMDVGSHTRTHRVLQTLPPSALEAELRGSFEDLERAGVEPVPALAYPVGRPVREPAIRAAIVATGYKAAFTYNTGVQSLRRLDPLDLRRLGVEISTDQAEFRAMLAFPRWS